MRYRVETALFLPTCMFKIASRCRILRAGDIIAGVTGKYGKYFQLVTFQEIFILEKFLSGLWF